MIGTAAIGASAIGLSVSGASSPKDTSTVATATPIKHVVVIFGENISFDHYFGTYPFATNPPGEPQFHAAPGTPTVNGLNNSLLQANPNVNDPQRLDPSQAVTCDQNHGYSAEQSAFDSGLMDKFVQDTTGGGCTQTNFPDQGNYGPNGIVMDYFDGNTVTALWNYAQHYTLNDNSYSTQFGPSTPGAINVISGQTNGATAHGGTTTNIENGTMIGDAEPLYDQCSNASTPLNSDGTPGGVTASMSGQNIGDLLNRQNITWGWFQGGFTPSAITAGRAICGTSHNNIANSPSADYSEHHEPFQYYASTANPDHVSPTSVSQVGVSDPAGTPMTSAVNHQYDLSWFNAAVKNGNMPAVSYLKAPEYEDAHAGYSDPLDEQRFLVDEINMIEQSKDWSSTAIVLAYDDSDGWYDHQMGPIIRPSEGPSDTLNGSGKCGSSATPPAQNDRCGVGPRQPLLVISPWAKQNFVDNTFTDQASIPQFIEDNWSLGRIGNESADSAAGTLMNAFDFNQKSGSAPAIILNDQTGEVTKVIQPNGQVDSPTQSPAPSGGSNGPSGNNGSSNGNGSNGNGWSGNGNGSQGGSSGSKSGSRTIVIKLPNLSCSHTAGSRSLVLTCTTHGGSNVQTLIRARMYQGKKLVSNKAGMVKHNRVKLTLSLGRQSRGGRYLIRLSIDAAGRVGSETRYVRVR
ncbi:MAG TPA: alkaline phosphatase family protein [Solirubrobacteraceae bacterium]|nr:alkaline phosphatase family protein [Solirubrobacteraceae bacterium]